MPFNLNKVCLAGKVGRDPDVHNFQGGGKCVSFSVATSEKWTDKASGERKEKTEWHRIAIFNERLCDIAERLVKKGCGVYIEGQLQTRKYTNKDGAEKETTEVVLAKFRGELHVIAGSSSGSQSGSSRPAPAAAKSPESRPSGGDFDDEIPF